MAPPPLILAWLTDRFIVAALDAPTASVITALVMAGATTAARWVPKTRTEAAVDRAEARVNDAEAWGRLVERLEAANAELDGRNADLVERNDTLTRRLADCEKNTLQLQRDYAAARAQLKRRT